MADGGPEQREDVSFLVFAASLRAASLNGRLAELAAQTIERNGGHVRRAEMREFDTPSYDQDLQDEGEIPPGAVALRDCIERCDAFVICSPEYNASMPGMLKNTIDWVSRFAPQPFNEVDGLLMSASPSMVGGNRGLWALRVPLEHLGAHLYPNMFSLAQAGDAFTDEQTIADEQLQARFDATIVGFMDTVEARKHYPCAKRAWYEYLGERLVPATARAE
ncbi:MAG TPA: NAD(P)H-dependent oxidoreductase [Solirubrobacteraceae bacterium]|nr:NAD(P)H-dependent oxidoreductase [Solirubrobacteraceae bacterium]